MLNIVPIVSGVGHPLDLQKIISINRAFKLHDNNNDVNKSINNTISHTTNGMNQILK